LAQDWITQWTELSTTLVLLANQENSDPACTCFWVFIVGRYLYPSSNLWLMYTHCFQLYKPCLSCLSLNQMDWLFTLVSLLNYVMKFLLLIYPMFALRLFMNFKICINKRKTKHAWKCSFFIQRYWARFDEQNVEGRSSKGKLKAKLLVMCSSIKVFGLRKALMRLRFIKSEQMERCLSLPKDFMLPGIWIRRTLKLVIKYWTFHTS